MSKTNEDSDDINKNSSAKKGELIESLNLWIKHEEAISILNRNNDDSKLTNASNEKYYDTLAKNYSNIIEKGPETQNPEEKSFIESINNLPFDTKQKFYVKATMSDALSNVESYIITTALTKGLSTAESQHFKKAATEAIRIQRDAILDSFNRLSDVILPLNEENRTTNGPSPKKTLGPHNLAEIATIQEQGKFHVNRNEGLTVNDDSKEKYYDTLAKNYSNIIEKDTKAQTKEEKSFIESINKLPFDRKKEFYVHAANNDALSREERDNIANNLERGHSPAEVNQFFEAGVRAVNIKHNLTKNNIKLDAPEEEVGGLKNALKAFDKYVADPVFGLVNKGSHAINEALGIAKKTPNNALTNKGGAIGNSKITFKGGKNQNGKQGKNVSPGGRN